MRKVFRKQSYHNYLLQSRVRGEVLFIGIWFFVIYFSLYPSGYGQDKINPSIVGSWIYSIEMLYRLA